MKIEEFKILPSYSNSTAGTPNLRSRARKQSRNHDAIPRAANRHRIYNSQDQISIQELIQTGQCNILGLTTNEGTHKHMTKSSY